MSFGYAARLGWVLTISCILITGIIGLYAYRASNDLLVAGAIEALSVNAVVMKDRLSALRRNVARDLGVLANHPSSRAVLQQNQGRPVADVEALFKLLMQQNPSYLQIRLITEHDFGLELVRVDRDLEDLVSVTGDELQEKGHFLYVSETLKLKSGEIYISPIVINHERGSHAGLHQPTSTFATPVVDNDGRVLGVIVLNLDLNNAFHALTADLPRHFRHFLTNQLGDFLIHPDPSRAFGFDRGQRILVQDEFPATAALIDSATVNNIVETQTNDSEGHSLVTIFIRDTDPMFFGANTLFLGVGAPRELVLVKADEMGRTILVIIGAISFGGVLLAVALARYMTLPINRLTDAVRHFEVNRDISALPTERTDELGQLACSFLDMQNKIRQQFEQLQKSNAEMETLAQHDALTGLFNRRKLDETLECEFARSQRFENAISVILLDIDHFKSVNDIFGHQVGDAVLRHLSDELKGQIRETDMLGRWGGEEFLIICPGNDLDGATMLAEKLRRIVRECEFPMVGRRTCSFGVASRHPGERENELIARADAALYQAKRQGRDRVVQANGAERRVSS
ncbi:Diguanylate cyclase [Magnetospirillum sp. LM-5]|uniref:sensor domain-containing diguanylate cyclase n=1 Tax=Magnetospirillum sp. LM-5 TaxID=2681466 RepID=UPI00137E32AC|nr:diguanylate cyclase [Magnetospirillum sp. LM-5]CAA7614352.1 Diguanylate cyclase [Magnetospirillum sp. LM-5]